MTRKVWSIEFRDREGALHDVLVAFLDDLEMTLEDLRARGSHVLAVRLEDPPVRQHPDCSAAHPLRRRGDRHPD